MSDLSRRYAGFRDAIHVPYIVVTCETALRPGEKCSLRHEDKCVPWGGSQDEPMWHGVADPFSEVTFPANTLVPVFIRKECFSGLRHDFQIEVNDRGGTETCHQVCDVF